MPLFSAAQVHQLGLIVKERVQKVIEQATPAILAELLKMIDKTTLSQHLMTECQDSIEIRCAPIDVCSFDWSTSGIYPAETGVRIHWTDVVSQPFFLERFANCLAPFHFTVKMVKVEGKAILRASFTANINTRQKESKCLYNKTGFAPKDHVITEGVCSCCGSYTAHPLTEARNRNRLQKEWDIILSIHNNRVAVAEHALANIIASPQETWPSDEDGDDYSSQQEMERLWRLSIQQAIQGRKQAMNNFSAV
jgi:hypothetical protein